MRRFTIIMSLSLALLFAGCSDQTVSPEAETEIENQAVPEPILKLLNDNSPGDDGSAPDGFEIRNSLDPNQLVDTAYDVYAITVLWGNLLNLPNPNDVITDWSGSLWVNAEAFVNVTYEISFEAGQDSVIPTNVPSMAAWVSKTAYDFDGLSFLVYFNPNNVYFAEPMVTFDTGPFSISLDFRQLIHFAAYYPVDNQNGVAILSKRLWHHGCPSGFMEGEWIKNGYMSDSGLIQGLWMSRDGTPLGYLTGTFWPHGEDGNYDGLGGGFAGSISGYYLTVVIAEFQGTWWYDDLRMCPVCGEGHGKFRGRYNYSTDEGGGGIMLGEFGDYSLPPDDINMPFIGIWRDDCVYAEDIFINVVD